MWSRFKQKFIGDRQFYKRVLFLALPMIVQNAITSFVSFLDNIMVGQIGTEQMSGVAIVNQLLFVFNICIFGGVSGAGIFSTQFYGKGDYEGQKFAFRFKISVVKAPRPGPTSQTFIPSCKSKLSASFVRALAFIKKF